MNKFILKVSAKFLNHVENEAKDTLTESKTCHEVSPGGDDARSPSDLHHDLHKLNMSLLHLANVKCATSGHLPRGENIRNTTITKLCKLDMFRRFVRFTSRLAVLTLRTFFTVVLTTRIRRKLNNSTELPILNVMAHLKNAKIDLFRK